MPDLSLLSQSERDAYQVVLNYLKSLSSSARQKILNDQEWHSWLRSNHPSLSHLFTVSSLQQAIHSLSSTTSVIPIPAIINKIPDRSSTPIQLDSTSLKQLADQTARSFHPSLLPIFHHLPSLLYDDLFLDDLSPSFRSAQNQTHVLFILPSQQNSLILPSSFSSLTDDQLLQLNKLN
jgi:hypothetical protein